MTFFKNRSAMMAASWLVLLPGLISNTDQPFDWADTISPAQRHKEQVSQAVFDDIANTARDYRQPPTFYFLHQLTEEDQYYYNAYYNPQNNGIYMSEALYDMATSFGKDSLNVLAMILGHELAHFYKDHGWGMSFGMANEDIKIAQKIYQKQYNAEERAQMEAEADYFGGLFGYLAGYNTLKVGGAFFKKLYAAAELPDTIKGYPTLEERVQICDNAKEKVICHLPLFQAANWSVLVGEYKAAAVCYDHVIKDVPSRELYNNAGVALIMEAIQTYKAPELRYAYPFALDVNTYLDTTWMAANKTDFTQSSSYRQLLLRRAKEKFEAAIKTDADYTVGYIHLSLTESLMGAYDMAAIHAEQAMKVASDMSDNAYMVATAKIARGIVYALQQDQPNAKKQWEAAAADNAFYAQANLEVLKDRAFARSLEKPAKEKDTEAVAFDVQGEQIADESLQAFDALIGWVKKDTLESFFKSTVLKSPSGSGLSDVYSHTYIEEKRHFDFMLMLTEGQIGAGKWAIMLTLPDYKGASAKGIRVGSTLQALQAAYGKQPAKRIATATGTLLYFTQVNNPKLGMVFELDLQQRVTRWGLVQHW